MLGLPEPEQPANITTDNILRNIIRQCLEWNTSLYINFVDFRKAFDSVHRNTVWKILHSYGIPPNIITIMKAFYENFEFSVIMGNTLSECFFLHSGVRQGCNIPPILFLAAIDWFMKNTIADRPRGIQWTMFSHLENLDFADDLAFLSTNHSYRLKLIDLTPFEQVGLNINTSKTQVMHVNSIPTAPILVNGEKLEFVEDFTYLGSLINKDSGAQRDVNARLGKAQVVFSLLNPVWRSKQYSLKTKMLIYNSNVKSVLLYGSEGW